MSGGEAAAATRSHRTRRTMVVVLTAITVVAATVTVVVVRVARDRSLDRSPLIRAELEALRRDLDAGAGEQMQRLFPEGHLFAHGLHGLAWTDLAASGRADPARAASEGERALMALDSEVGTAPFDRSLSPPRGVFYAGWVLLLRAGVARLGPAGSRARERVIADADVLAAAFRTALADSRSPFLEAYPGQSWPVDSVVAMAALRATSPITGGVHDRLVDRWVVAATEHVDPAAGLLPHRTVPGSGRALQGPRGTSQSIIQRFWPAVAPADTSSYGRFRQDFVATVAGAVGVREYPPGVDGEGDIDSGPLVLGLSASASTVTIGAARANGDGALAVALTQEAELAGLPLGTSERRYLLGRLPVADSMLAWARATPAGAAQDRDDLVTWWPVAIATPVWVPVAVGWWWFGRTRRRRPAPPTRGEAPTAARPA